MRGTWRIVHEQLFAPLAASGKALLDLGWDSAGQAAAA
jgi:hypothetical protein